MPLEKGKTRKEKLTVLHEGVSMGDLTVHELLGDRGSHAPGHHRGVHDEDSSEEEEGGVMEGIVELLGLFS